MLLKTNHTLDILPKKESFLLHISIFQIHFFIPPSIFLSFLFNFSLLSFNVTFFMNTHHLKFENWDFADDINEKKKMTMMITFEKKTKKKHSSYVENIYIYLSFAGTKNIIAKSMKNTCTLFNHKVFHQKANSQS